MFGDAKRAHYQVLRARNKYYEHLIDFMGIGWVQVNISSESKGEYLQH